MYGSDNYSQNEKPSNEMEGFLLLNEILIFQFSIIPAQALQNQN